MNFYLKASASTFSVFSDYQEGKLTRPQNRKPTRTEFRSWSYNGQNTPLAFVFPAVLFRFCVFSLPVFLNFARFSILIGTPRVPVLDRCWLVGLDLSTETWLSKAR